MVQGSGHEGEDRLVFMSEDSEPGEKKSAAVVSKDPWKILIVDDEDDVHEITKITLRGFCFDSRGVELLSAYSEKDVKQILSQRDDIALVILDVVMERDDSGLRMVEYIREGLGNQFVRIVLRTGQPGKAPEQEVITKYDINDYKTKPDLTAQKLFTMVTACLRSYKSLKTIEKNTAGLKNIIHASSKVLNYHSRASFGAHVLEHLFKILNLENNADRIDSAYFIGAPDSAVTLIAGTGSLSDKTGQMLDHSMPASIAKACGEYRKTGGETLTGHEYIGVFKTQGALLSVLYFAGWNQLSATDRNLLRIYANNIAFGFDNISLTRELINTQKEVILTLGEVVETRSQETAHHVARVAEVCYLIAKKYGLEEDSCETIRWASPMHDVGKIGIPESILNKPGRLTDEEFGVIKGHARIGYEILKKSSRAIMQSAAIIALQHHERWDGKGYPQGLAGNDIHIFGRITAVADVFDALSHQRCYKDAWGMSEIIETFKADSGSHFDPDLVEILLSNIEEFEVINKRFPE